GGTVYGNPEHVRVNEDAPRLPISYHGAAKSAAELFLQAFSYTGYPVAILRPSNVYGPDQSGPAGFGLVRTILQHMRSGVPMEIWGDGSSLRDYLYIDDLIEAVTQVQQHGCTGIFNAGSGIGHSVLEVIACAELVTNGKLSLILKTARISDVKGVVLDYSKLNKTTGWAPSTDLESGIRQTWEWLSLHQ
ncbi:MAG TPA: NAD-dependent epimerase/dehydratase family protein, partial [Methylophilaceae bacterium]|nr:NAD-dependent epimerase/dehydratase family protein [Methylophilaceae bacterium]